MPEDSPPADSRIPVVPATSKTREEGGRFSKLSRIVKQ